MRNTFVATALLGALVLVFLSEPTRGQDSQSDLEKRIGKLEQRVATLERLLSVQSVASSVTVAGAESRLAATEEQLQHTERLHKKGFVTKLQLDADRFAVAKALKELQLAKAAEKDKKTALEIDVLDAEEDLAVATEHLKHSERLRAKGFVSELQVTAAKLEVERVRKRLDRAQAKLKTHEQSLKDVDNQDSRTNPHGA